MLNLRRKGALKTAVVIVDNIHLVKDVSCENLKVNRGFENPMVTLINNSDYLSGESITPGAPIILSPQTILKDSNYRKSSQKYLISFQLFFFELHRFKNNLFFFLFLKKLIFD